ncbi:MAG: UDP-N-acetylmuramate--L-alanine ligase [Acidobacteriota bacterium]
MSGIAELLANLGYRVTGSDVKRSEVTDRLETLGVRVSEGHDARLVVGADVVVTSSAVGAGNPEIAEAHRRRIPVIPRAEMLAELMRLRSGIAVAGSHGKTTTTSMVALVLERAGLDPTAVIGGKLSAFGSNARLGRGPYMVVEADESDRSFLRLSPTLAIITNVDHEHLDAYRDFDDLCAAFADFANRVPFYGAVVACVDDPHLRSLIPRLTRRVVTYGLEPTDADLVGRRVRQDGTEWVCSMEPGPGLRDAVGLTSAPPPGLGDLRLRVPGRHNLLNALAAVVVGLELGLAIEAVAAALRAFQGADRRFQVRGEARGVQVIDDYGHHPTEIAAVLDAARIALGRRLVVVFQPHRYSRTAALLEAFGPALSRADVVVLTDIYPAGEAPVPGATLEALAAAIDRHLGPRLRVAPSLDQALSAVLDVVSPGDAVITLGAGSISALGPRLLDALGGGHCGEARA